MLHLPHLILWPFKKLYEWFRGSVQNKQLKEQTALIQKQLLLQTIPNIVVSLDLIRNPDPPRRNDIPTVDVDVRNYGGETYLFQGHFLVTFTNGPTYKQEKYLADIEMPIGKGEKFYFIIKRPVYDQIMARNTILKISYQLKFKGVNGQPEEKKDCRKYDAKKKVFIPDAQ